MSSHFGRTEPKWNEQDWIFVLDLAVLLFAFLIDVVDRVVCDLCVDMYGVRNVESDFVCVCVIHHQSILLQPANINIPLWRILCRASPHNAIVVFVLLPLSSPSSSPSLSLSLKTAVETIVPTGYSPEEVAAVAEQA